jgi:hypothetical protein
MAEQALVTANSTLQEARAGLRERKREIGEIKGAIEATELQIPPKPEALRPGPTKVPVKRDLDVPELLELLYQAFKPYDLGEHRAHALETNLRNFEGMHNSLEREKEERAKAGSTETSQRPPNKRVRPSEEAEEDEMADTEVGALLGPPTPTPIADEDDDDALEAAEASATALAEQGVGSASEIAVSADAAARVNHSPSAARPASDDAVPQGAGDTAQPGAGARVGQRERSPRRETPAGRQPTALRWADQEEEDETPPLTAAQSAALRGDTVEDSIDSLPTLEEVPPLHPPSNQRGGALLS